MFFLGLAVVCATTTAAVVPQFIIDLDRAPEDRYSDLFVSPETGFNESVWVFYSKYFAEDEALTEALYGLSAKRGPENAELQGEIEGLANLSKLPREFVSSIQMLYELQTLMVPTVNLTDAADNFPRGYEGLARIPWRGPGCTGIIALNSMDNSVYHARNLDFSPKDIMAKLVYNGIFMKGGVEVFRSQMVAGYACVITGAVFGKDVDGYALERNTRYPDHQGGYEETLSQLAGGAELNGWQLRKILETEGSYNGAVQAISTAPFASSEYVVVSGVKKGCILARNPDGLAHRQVLGQPNHGERGDYLIITNFDFFWHDVREWFDPTGGLGMFHPRRIAAQEVLNASEYGKITPGVLWAAINSKGNFADTIFQAIINVELNLWNTSQPSY